VLSDHKPQLLKLHNHIAPTQQFTSCYVRNINNFTVDGFQPKLNTESWEDFFKDLTQMLYLATFKTLIKFLCTFH